MENEHYNRRGRSGSRASSTSSSLEVRCACQYFRSYSLLPERSALAAASRPAVKKQGLRMVQTPPAGRRLPVRCGDHEYEPIGIPPMVRMAISQHSMMSDRLAPVVKITDTDVIPVVDSDDSIDDRYRFRAQALILEGDVILPLDGRIEDNAMDGRNLGDQTIDTSADELDSPQQFQDRLEQQFQIAAQQGFVQQLTLNGAQNSSSRVDSPTPPPASGAHGFQQKLKSQAGRIRSRFKNIQKPTMPTFHMPHIRSKPSEKTSDKPSDKPFEKPSDKPSDKPSEKPSDKPSEKPSDKPSEKSSDRPSEKPPDKPPTTEAPPSPKPPPSPHQKASRMERFRMALPERPRFSLPDKSKFHLPDKSKFHLPDKSKFHLPERPKFNLPDRSKFHIKKPNIQLPKSFSKSRRTASLRVSQSPEQSQVSNAESNASTEQKKHIFDFSTFPRPKLFDRKSKAKAEYVTSSPKESRAQSTESSTFPRTKKSSLSLSARWAQRFGETRGIHDDTAVNPEHVVDRSKPWRHPSLEEPRLSLKPQTSEEEEEKLPWENTERITYDVEEVVLPEKEVEREEILYADGADIKEQEFSYDKEPVKDPRIYDDQLMKRIGTEEPKKKVRLVEDEDEGSIIDPEAEDDTTYHPRGLYDGSFPPVDPREFPQRAHSVEISEDEEEESMRSDREIQQSSGSSCERRRRGVIEEIDSDEFFLREKGISQENMRYHLISEIRIKVLTANKAKTLEREALRPRADNDLPPQRPKRMRSLRKRQVESLESFDTTPPPERPKRERSSQLSLERMSTHRIVYQTEAPIAPSKNEFGSGPLDDIVVVKPVRRKSKSSLRSQSQSRLPVEEQNIVLAPLHSEIQASQLSATTPPIPRRRKRLRRDQSSSLSIRTVDSALCNGFGDAGSLPQSHERIPPTPPPTPPPLSREEEFDYLERAAARAPVPPKRTRSHSRTASLAAEDDRTSHGAESLPGDFGYADEDSLPAIPRDSSSREPSLPGYAIIEKKEKPPRPPPPRRKKQDKFATAPRPSKNGPKRPLRNYSTLRPAKSDTIRKSVDSIPFMDADYDLDHEDEDFHKDLRSGEVLSRMQARPLPAPPRPPRHKRDIHYQPEARRSLPREITPDFSETVASTQTDPLPDDLVIEEEITTAKLVVAPSRSGSQILIRTERVPSPTGESYKSVPTTPPIPPLPSHRASEQQRDIERSRIADTGESEQKLPSSTEPRRFDTSQLELLRSALFSTDEPLRIPSLEVGDLKVERLTVSQLEAYKVAASEIDAIVVSATEMSNKSETEGGIHPSLLQELIAIRNQLEAVAASQPQSRPQSAMEDASTATSNERIDAALDELARSSEKQLFEIKRSFSRESSPLLVVQRSTPEKEAIDILGRTVLPQSSSITDLTSTSDSPTVVSEIQASLILTDTVEEPLITVVEPPTDEHLPSMDEPATTPSIATETTTTTTTMTTTTTSELPVTTRSTSRSRSSSPSRGPPGAVRQTASPVKSLPPVISVTLDSITSTTLDNNNCSMPLRHVTSSGVQPQRAVISYQTSYEDSPKSSPHPSRETSQSPPPPPTSSPARESSRSPPTICDSPQPPQIHTQYIAFPTSQIPPEFFSLANPPLSSSTTDLQNQQVRRDVEVEPSIAEMTSQLMRALRLAGTRSLRHFVDSVVSRFGSEEEAAVADTPDVKVRRVELAVCALLILIASLIIIVICNPRTVTHHHHWDYFNPPQ